MYWRVAVVDPDGNVGRLQQGQEVHAAGAHAGADRAASRRTAQRGVVVITVLNAKGKPIKGVAVKLRGAGVRTGRTGRTRRAS